MKYLYAVKGCSHCEIRESCDLKDSTLNLLEKMREIKEGRIIWWSYCKDFFRTEGKNE